MHIYVCSACFFALRVLDGPSTGGDLVGPSSELWGKQHECPACSVEQMAGHPERALDHSLMAKLRIRDLEPAEAYVAITGGGLPEEQLATADAVRKALTASPVEHVSAHNIPGTTRAVITRLTLADGTRLYFGAGPLGATVYRVARREEL